MVRHWLKTVAGGLGTVALAAVAGCAPESPGIAQGGPLAPLPPIYEQPAEPAPGANRADPALANAMIRSRFAVQVRRMPAFSEPPVGAGQDVAGLGGAPGAAVPGIEALPEVDDAPGADKTLELGDVCTHAAEAWGVPCAGDEIGAGCLRDDHFLEIYGPDGALVVGGEKRVTLRTAEAVERALPGAGSADVIAQDVTDPGESRLNRLGAELVALRLNLDFTRAGLLGSRDLGRLRLAGGPLAGWRVDDVAHLGEAVLGGEPSLIIGLDMDLDGLADQIAKINGAGPACAAPTAIRW